MNQQQTNQFGPAVGFGDFWLSLCRSLSGMDQIWRFHLYWTIHVVSTLGHKRLCILGFWVATSTVNPLQVRVNITQFHSFIEL